MNTPQYKSDIPCQTAHLVGAYGAGMRALAELLSDRGWTLTGSDQSEPDSSLNSGPQQIHIHHNHSASHVSPQVDVLIYSPAVGVSNPERVAARQMGIPEFSYSRFLGELMRERTSCCIAGTHGKTTTAAILATILRESGQSPDAAIGGEVIQYNRSGWSGHGQFFVAESCEYRKHFLEHSPQFATILGIERDHFDCFPDWDSQLNAFTEFAGRVPGDGVLVVPAACRASAAAACCSAARTETFFVEPSSSGSTTQATWLARNLTRTETGFRFHVDRHGSPFCETETRVPGRHNVENALAAIAVAHAAGADAEAIAPAVAAFCGVRRRFEILSAARNFTV
ncbi:MAG: Mur ligase family protein, partial [Planctomycetaceae bacterium]